MFRSIVSRGSAHRTTAISRSLNGSLKKRYISSPSSTVSEGGGFGAKAFGALVTLGAVLFISPCNIKCVFPNSQKSEEVKPESRPNLDPKKEVSETQESSETNSAAPKKDEKGTAYNPDTGEINWDCPCLGGMAHGPCGEEFKAAFACFVYSEAEPKGIDCVTKFQHMQDCFREHPEHYAEQLRDEEEATAGEPVVAEAVEVDVEVPEGQEPEPVATETVSAEVVSTEPVPAEVVSAEPVPAEPVPAEPVPAEAVPAEAVPAEAVPAEAVLTESVSIEPSSTEAVVEPTKDAEAILIDPSDSSEEPVVEETDVVIVDIPEEESK